jgi:hypothetical protein
MLYPLSYSRLVPAYISSQTTDRRFVARESDGPNLLIYSTMIVVDTTSDERLVHAVRRPNWNVNVFNNAFLSCVRMLRTLKS